MKIETGRKYDDGSKQIFEITKHEKTRLEYREIRTGYQGHLILDNNIIYEPNLFAGHYYPTNYKIID